MRLILGFALTPIFGVAFLGVVFGWDSNHYLYVGRPGLFFAYCATIAFGLPLFLLFYKFYWLTWWQVSGGGLLAGVLTTISMALFADGPSTTLDFAKVVCPTALVAGLTFWLIAIFRNRALAPVSKTAHR
jgi:putative effector of murein hydrolase